MKGFVYFPAKHKQIQMDIPSEAIYTKTGYKEDKGANI